MYSFWVYNGLVPYRFWSNGTICSGVPCTLSKSSSVSSPHHSLTWSRISAQLRSTISWFILRPLSAKLPPHALDNPSCRAGFSPHSQLLPEWDEGLQVKPEAFRPRWL